MIAYCDFVPRLLAPAGFLTPAAHDSFDSALEAANEWISANSIRVVNIETVVLPNIWSRFEEGSTDTSLGTGESPSQWHQFIRVWYDAS